MTHINFGSLKYTLTVITGGAGIIGKALALGIASLGGRTVILDINAHAAETVAGEICSRTGSLSVGIAADVLDKNSLRRALDEIHEKAGPIRFLINAAGGNAPAGTTRLEEILPENAGDPEGTFYGLDPAGLKKIFDLNYFGTLLPVMIFSRDMLKGGRGAILNITSLSALHPLTKVPAYSSAKAAVSNFTEWLAVHLAKTGIRVNAIAPGFVLTNQNRFLLTDENTGELTPRGKKILAGTPMGRFGTPDELAATAAFLLSDMACFITGTVVIVDGGYNAYSGV